MTNQEWNLVFDALIAVLLVFYGFWLRNIFRQQLGSKDSAIEALKATIASKEAEIARLKEEAAPAIVEGYRKMREHADEMTAAKTDMESRLNKLKLVKRTSEKLLPISALSAECEGLQLASKLVLKAFEPFLSLESFPPDGAAVLVRFIEALEVVKSEMKLRIAKATELLGELEKDIQTDFGRI